MFETDEQLRAAYLAGIRLFNEGHYWHAHEQWERCWLAAEDEQQQQFYQALIQAAAALVKWRQGNRRGLERNWAKSRSRMIGLPVDYRGLDLLCLHEQLERICSGEAEVPPQLHTAHKPPEDA